ncbi:hypothetical protein [Cupriavidus necator]
MAITTFGNQTLGGTGVQMPPGNNKAVCRFQNNTGNAISVKKVWMKWGSSNSGTIKFKAVIYSDSSGSPANLLATSPEMVGHGSDWVAFDISPALNVAAGAFVWAGVIADGTDIGGNCLGTGQIYYNSDTYSDGPSATFGTPSVAGFTYPVVLEGDDGQMRLGRSSVDAGSGNYQPDREHGDKFVLAGTDSVSVTSISTYVNTTSATVKSKAAIFNDSGGLPSTKVAQTTEVTGSTAGAWLTLPFASPLTLAPGTYWLCFISSENLQTPTIPFGGSLRADGADTEASAFTSPSTLSVNLAPVGIDIYATYTAIAPGETPIAGSAPASLSGIANLALGTELTGDASASISGLADLDTGTPLVAVGRLDVTPRARFAGAGATPGIGNFFLLF